MIDRPRGTAAEPERGPAMSHGRKIIAVQIQLALLIFATCGLTSEREQAILGYSTDRHMEKYADLLVEEERYTTVGLQYQKKYLRHLIGIAGHIIENMRLTIEKNSIGFYYYEGKSGNT
ncbi:MAG: hypothetical protein E4G96_08670, partial [Chrysiogenales bacterium]